tara:strand:+ start:254 stop:754 length:501 start_codon:yes stop_codon:yes gene_type:complete
VTFINWKRWLLKGLLIFAIFLAVSSWNERNLIPEKEPAPSFTLNTIDGSNISLKNLQGQRVLIYFFAPWCKFCDLSISNLNLVKKIRGKTSISILAVALSYKDKKSLNFFLKRNPLDVPVLLGSSKVLDDYSINAFPTIYTIDKLGKIESTSVGYATTLGLLWKSF